jgi:hypothetical protein
VAQNAQSVRRINRYRLNGVAHGDASGKVTKFAVDAHGHDAAIRKQGEAVALCRGDEWRGLKAHGGEFS